MESDEKPFRSISEAMKGIITVKASSQAADERDTPTTAGVRNDRRNIGEIEERNQERDSVDSGLEPESAGKKFIVIDQRG